MKKHLLACVLVLSTPALFADESAMVNQQFEQLAERYVQEFPALSPVSATQLGDHRFDGELEEISPAARQHELAFCQKYL
jgi:hypothetical protein